MIVHRDIRREELEGAFKDGLIAAESVVGRHVKGLAFHKLSLAIYMEGVEQIGKEAMGSFREPGTNEGSA